MSAASRQEAIRRMCQLQAKAADVVGYSYAADCFCGESGFHPLRDPDDYRNDFKAIEWLEELVARNTESSPAVTPEAPGDST